MQFLRRRYIAVVVDGKVQFQVCRIVDVESRVLEPARAERQQSLCIEHECCALVMRHRGRQNSVQSQPHEAFDELMNRKQ